MPPNYEALFKGAASKDLYEAAGTTARSSQYDIAHEGIMSEQKVSDIGSITSTISDTLEFGDKLFGKGEFDTEFKMGKKVLGKKYGDIKEVTESGESFSDLTYEKAGIKGVMKRLFSERHYQFGDTTLTKGDVIGFGRGAQYGISPDLSMYEEQQKGDDDDKERWPRNAPTGDDTPLDDRGGHGSLTHKPPPGVYSDEEMVEFGFSE